MPLKPISSSNHWVLLYKQNPKARLRLFCFPYAGSGASIFRDWADALPSEVEVCPIQLPGRESRLKEQPFSHINDLVSTLSFALQSFLDKPFSFWGHSMGALISFELARQLRRENKPQPRHLFVSSFKAPQIPELTYSIHQLPDVEFLEEVRRLNGIPDIIWQNSELMQLILPILRSDIAMVEKYEYVPEPALGVSISAFGGLQDKKVSYEALNAWEAQTQSSYSLRMFLGDHFYLHGCRSQLLQVVSQTLKQIIRRLPT